MKNKTLKEGIISFSAVLSIIIITVFVLSIPKMIEYKSVRSLPYVQNNTADFYSGYLSIDSISDMNIILEDSQQIIPYVTSIAITDTSYNDHIFDLSVQAVSKLQTLCEEQIVEGFDTKLQSLIDFLNNSEHFPGFFNYMDIELYDADNSKSNLIIYQVFFDCYNGDKKVTFEVYLNESMDTVYYLSCCDSFLNYENYYSKPNDPIIGTSWYTQDDWYNISINDSMMVNFYEKVPESDYSQYVF